MLLRRLRLLALLAATGLSCGESPYIELQIADERLPFLRANTDFDALGVEASHASCATTVVRYPPRELPATLSIVPGDCFEERLTLRAFAHLGERRVAESGLLGLVFPDSGAEVITATLTDLPGPRVLFRTGFEAGEPAGGAERLFAVQADDVLDLVARIDRSAAAEGEASIVLSGVATSTRAHVLVRAVAMDLVIASGDRLRYQMRIDSAEVPPAFGIELELDTGATARSLALRDETGASVAPGTADLRDVGTWQSFAVDLSIAARSRLVGVLFGFDARERGGLGSFSAHLDDLAIDAR